MTARPNPDKPEPLLKDKTEKDMKKLSSGTQELTKIKTMYGHRKRRIPLKVKISFRENLCSSVAKILSSRFLIFLSILQEIQS
jgi:hypothetical protein